MGVLVYHLLIICRSFIKRRARLNANRVPATQQVARQPAALGALEEEGRQARPKDPPAQARQRDSRKEEIPITCGCYDNDSVTC